MLTKKKKYPKYHKQSIEVGICEWERMVIFSFSFQNIFQIFISYQQRRKGSVGSQ